MDPAVPKVWMLFQEIWGVESSDEAHVSAKRKTVHSKVTRRALGSCAMLQLSGVPLQEDVRTLGNEIVAVLGTHHEEEDMRVLLSKSAAPACLGPKAPGICLMTLPSACEGPCVLPKNTGDSQMRTIMAKH